MPTAKEPTLLTYRWVSLHKFHIMVQSYHMVSSSKQILSEVFNLTCKIGMSITQDKCNIR